MKIQYKIKRKYVPTCSECGEELRGNGSTFLPYECSCGEWKFDLDSREYYLQDLTRDNRV